MPPLSVMVKPASSLCNMRCKYCFYEDIARNREIGCYGIMSIDTLEILVRRAMAYAEGSCSFMFQGGEPTLAGIDFYRSVVALQSKYNARGIAIENSIQTNAYDMTDEMASFFARNRFLVGVSLDGTRETHDAIRVNADGKGTYDRVKEGINKLYKARADVNILCVVNSYVASEPARVFKALSPFGYIQFIACLDGLNGETYPHSLSAKAYATFLKTTFDLYYECFRKRRFISVRTFDNYVGILAGRAPEMCAASGRCGAYYLIESDASVYPCDFYVLDDYRMGNIQEQSFYKLERSEIAQNFRHRNIPDKCASCKWFRLCRGGCRRDRTNDDENKWCQSYKELFEYAQDRMREMAVSLTKTPELFIPNVEYASSIEKGTNK